MRFVSFSSHASLQDAVRVLRRLRKYWIFPTLSVALGLGLGIWLATFAKEPEYVPLLLRVLSGQFKPFGAWFPYALLLVGWLLFCYVSGRFSHRVPYLLYCLFVGYVWGRIVYFCVTFSALGVVSALVLELFWFAFCFFVSLFYYAAIGDVLFCSLRPQFNRGALSRGVRYLVLGTLVLLAAFLLWGVVARLVNLP